jgi:hypothetical protein
MALDYITEPAGIFQDWLAISPLTTAKDAPHPVNTRVTTRKGRILLYGKAGEALTKHLLCTLDDDGLWKLTTKALADEFHPTLGISCSAAALNKYAWFCIEQVDGDATDQELGVTTAGAVVVHAEVYTSATAGKVDDVTTSQTKIRGINFRTAPAGAEVEHDVVFANIRTT